MEKTITELKAAAYDARAAYEAAVSRLKASPKMIAGFPTLAVLEHEFQAAQATWETAEAELLNAVSERLGMTAKSWRASYPGYEWAVEDLRQVL